MQFGIFYEHQMPRPWREGDEHRLCKEALDQVYSTESSELDPVITRLQGEALGREDW